MVAGRDLRVRVRAPQAQGGRAARPAACPTSACSLLRCGVRSAPWWRGARGCSAVTATSWKHTWVHPRHFLSDFSALKTEAPQLGSARGWAPRVWRAGPQDHTERPALLCRVPRPPGGGGGGLGRSSHLWAPRSFPGGRRLSPRRPRAEPPFSCWLSAGATLRLPPVLPEPRHPPARPQAASLHRARGGATVLALGRAGSSAGPTAQRGGL